MQGKTRVTTNPYHSGGHVSGTDRRRVSAALAALLSLVGHDDEYQKEMPMLVNLYSREWLQTTRYPLDRKSGDFSEIISN